MVREELAALLKQGAQVWNEWRFTRPNIQPNFSNLDLSATDLSQVDLHRVNLRGANLHTVDLSEANLSGANLNGANLNGANLSRANLSRANLSRANLSGVSLYRADLRETNLEKTSLSGANLSEANLCSARLKEADLSHVTLGWTLIGDVDLSTIQGWGHIQHLGPSTIGVDTLYLSQGKIPVEFLIRAGISKFFIEHTQNLFTTMEFFSCFISYANKDHTFAERLHADLQNKGVRCWFAPEDMKIGDRLRPRIDETIHLYDKLLLVLSKTSMASQWVEQEVETALARERQQGTTILFPVRIDNTVMTVETGWPALIRNTRNIGNFRRWRTHGVYQKAFDRLLRDLTATAQQPGASA